MINSTLPRAPAIKATTNLSFAAYVHMRGLKVLSAREHRRASAIEYEFAFDDAPDGGHPNGQWEQMHIDWANSEAMRFDHAVRELKKLCKRNGSG